MSGQAMGFILAQAECVAPILFLSPAIPAPGPLGSLQFGSAGPGPGNWKRDFLGLRFGLCFDLQMFPHLFFLICELGI